MTSFLAGLGLGLSLIVAIGAQNVFVLRQGIRGEHVLLVAAICAASDAVLIVLGVSGIGAVTTAAPWLVGAIRWAGAAFLVGYGVLAARRALSRSAEAISVESVTAAESPARSAGEGAGPSAQRATATALAPARATITTAGTVALTCLALTWLNPHVYLDTVFLLGSVGSAHGDDRWVFALGAMCASIAWFFSLAYGARWLGRWLSTVRAWRILDGIIAVVMVGLGVSLVL